MTLYQYFLNWLPALIVLAITIFFYYGFRVVSVKLIRFLLDKLPFDVDESIAAAIYRPGRLLIATSGLYGFLYSSPCSGYAGLALVQNLCSSFYLIAVYWILYNCFSSTNYLFHYFFSRRKKAIDPAISSLLSTFFRGLIIFLAIASVLSTWGVNIAGFIAGLSIGGLAVSLAAKDSLSNFFACLVILADQPFRIGDWIICNDVEGVVESISFRSTNVRTFTQSLVYIPNSIIVNTPIQNFTNRDRRRLEITLGVTYSTTRQQMQELVKKITNFLRQNPDIIAKDISVAFSEMADSSLNITIICYCRHTSYNEYMKAKEAINLELMRILEEVGTSAAFPSTSVYVEKTPAGKE